MADEKEAKKEGEEEGESKAPPKSKKVLIIIIVVVVLLLVVGGVGAYMVLGNKKDDKSVEDITGDHEEDSGELGEGSSDEDELEEGEEEMGAMHPLETFVVNLTGGKYVRTQIQIEFIERDIPKRFYIKLIPIKDGIIALLSSKTEANLSTAEGRRSLKEEIKEVVNDFLKKQEVKNVYFTQFIIQ